MNPSCWLDPIWGVSNYLVFRGLVKYGFDREAAELAEKTVALLEKIWQRVESCMNITTRKGESPSSIRAFRIGIC